MKRLLVVAIVVALVGSLVATPVLAGKHGPAGKSNIGHLYLYEKYVQWNDDGNGVFQNGEQGWVILNGGAWGKLKYNLSGSTFDFVFNGHGLPANANYSLIVYDDPWPGNNPGAPIASGTSNKGGNIHLKGSVDLGRDLVSTKIWLIPSADYDPYTSTVTRWPAPYNCDLGVPAWAAAPDDWLFENNLINYTDTDPPSNPK